MGFGTLFIGYFLLMNLTYYGYTDLIAGLVMLMALYKLKPIDKNFSIAILPTAVFTCIAAVEMVSAVGLAFGANMDFLLNYTDPARYLCICFITERILAGIAEVAGEVGVDNLARNARVTRPFAIAVFALGTLLQFPFLDKLIPTVVISVTAIFLTFAIFIQLVVVLFDIYSAYRWICMPEDVDNEVGEKKSRFEFINKFRERAEEKNKEYADFRFKKMKEKAEKKSSGRKKKK